MGRPPNNCNVCCGDTPPESDCYTSICVAFIDTNAVEAMTVEEAVLLNSKIRRWSLAYPNRPLFVFEVESPHEVEYFSVVPDDSLKYHIFSVKAEHDKSGNPLNIPSAKIARDNGNGSVAETNDPWGTIIRIKDAYNVPFGGDSGYPARTKSPKELFDEANQVLIHVENSSTISPSQISATVAKFKADAQSAGYSVADANTGFTRDFLAPFAYSYCCKNNNQLAFLYLCGIDQSYCFPTKIEFTKQPQPFAVFREYCSNTVFDPNSPYEEVCGTCVDPDTAQQNQIITYGATLTNSLGDEINEAINYELQRYDGTFNTRWGTIEGLGADASSVERSLNALLENWQESNLSDIHPLLDTRLGFSDLTGTASKDIYPRDLEDIDLSTYTRKPNLAQFDKISAATRYDNFSRGRYSSALLLHYSGFSGNVYLYKYDITSNKHVMHQKIYYDGIDGFQPPEGIPWRPYCRGAEISPDGSIICLLFGGRQSDFDNPIDEEYYTISIMVLDLNTGSYVKLGDYTDYHFTQSRLSSDPTIHLHNYVANSYLSGNNIFIQTDVLHIFRINSDNSIVRIGTPLEERILNVSDSDRYLNIPAFLTEKGNTVKGRTVRAGDYDPLDPDPYVFVEFFSHTLDKESYQFSSGLCVYNLYTNFRNGVPTVVLTYQGSKVIKIFRYGEDAVGSGSWDEREYIPQIIKRYPNARISFVDSNSSIRSMITNQTDRVAADVIILRADVPCGNSYDRTYFEVLSDSISASFSYQSSFSIPRCDYFGATESANSFPRLTRISEGDGKDGEVLRGYYLTVVNSGRTDREPVIRSFDLIRIARAQLSKRYSGACVIKNYSTKFRIKASFKTFDSRVTPGEDNLGRYNAPIVMPEANLQAYSSEFTLRDYETREYSPPVYYKIYVSDGSEQLCDPTQVHYSYPANTYQWQYRNSPLWYDFYYDATNAKYYIDVLSGQDVYIRINPAYRLISNCNPPYILDGRIFFWKVANNCLGYFSSYYRSGTTGYIVYPNVIKNDTIRATHTCTQVLV